MRGERREERFPLLITNKRTGEFCCHSLYRSQISKLKLKIGERCRLNTRQHGIDNLPHVRNA